MLGSGSWIVEWHNPREGIDGSMRAEDEERAVRLVSELVSLGNVDVTYREVARGWTSKVELHRDEIAEILDALADARDPYGEEGGDLELRLSNLLHRGDRQVAAKQTTKGTE